jgi:hypothetical protein
MRLEGDIDTSHFGFLHASHINPDDFEEGYPARPTLGARCSKVWPRIGPMISVTAWSRITMLQVR